MKDANGVQSCLKSVCNRTIRPASFTARSNPRGFAAFQPAGGGGWAEGGRGGDAADRVHGHNISISYSNVQAVNSKSVDAAET